MLEKYKGTITKAAKTLEVSVEEALGRFILNLNVMNEQFEGFENVNFREAGQAWNKMLSSQRNADKKAFLATIKSTAPRISKEGASNE